MNSLNISGAVDDSGNNMRDYRFVNADFDEQMSVPIQFLTEGGRKQIGDAYENFGSNTSKTWSDTGGAVWRGIDGIAISKTAFKNYDDVIKEVNKQYQLRNEHKDIALQIIRENPQDYQNFDEFAHEKVAEQYGSYVGNPFIAALFRAGGETGQFFYYSG